MEDAVDQAFWRRYARAAQLLNLVIVAIDSAYVFATWETGANRPLLAIVNLVALVGVLATLGASLEERIATSKHRDAIFTAWCLSGALVVSFAVWADGGVDSPLSWLFGLSVMFTAIVHRPALVAVSGVGATVGFVVVAAVDGSLGDELAAVLVRTGYLLALTYAAVSAAEVRWSHHLDQLVLRDKLSALADRDSLTGLYNHRAFHEHLAGVTGSTQAAVLMLDLDHFKAVNDDHGHLVGDDVLRAVTAAICASIGPGDVAARIGGEEFAVLMPGATPERAGTVAERIRRGVGDLVEPVPVTASIGLGCASGKVDGPRLLEQADGALYEAKRQGRNRVCWLQVA